MILSLRGLRLVAYALLYALGTLSAAAATGPAGWHDALEQSIKGMSAWYSPDERSHLVLQSVQPWPGDPGDAWVSTLAAQEVERQRAKGQLEKAFPIDWRQVGSGVRIATLRMHTRRNDVNFTEELLFVLFEGRQVQRAHLMSPRSHEGHAAARHVVLQHMREQMAAVAQRPVPSALNTHRSSADARSPDAIVLAAGREQAKPTRSRPSSSRTADPLPAVPRGWQLEEQLDVDEPALDGFVRYAAPGRELLVYLAPGQPPAQQAPADWLRRFNRARNFDENGTRAVTFSPVSVKRQGDTLLARQAVLVEVEQNWPYQIDTVAVLRKGQPIQWAALVQAAEQAPSQQRLAQAEALILSARRRATAGTDPG